MLDLSFITTNYDLPIVDAGAIGCAVIFPAVRWLNHKVVRKKELPPILIFFLDLLRGAAFFPFIVLIIGACSKNLLEHFIEANRTTIFLSGVIGAASVFKSDRWMMDSAREPQN